MNIDGLVETVHAYVKQYVSDALASVAKFVKERDAALRLEIAEAVAKSGPQGERGEKGDSGAQGEPGPQGEPGANGADGRPGEPGAAGEKGADGINGKDGAAGADGRSVTAEDFRQMFEAESSKWFLEYERRTNDAIKERLAAIPPPKDGVDGFGFDDFDVVYDGERGVTFRFQHGDRLIERAFVIPLVIDRGVFKRGATYQMGDGATHGGSYWIAQKETGDAPGEGNSSWRLAVKRGRDGKDK